MIRFVTHQDIEQWLQLAKEVEPLFGEMVGVSAFTEGIKGCIADSSALCITHIDDDIMGIISYNSNKNEIEWLAVKNKYRGNGYGYQLVEAAIQHLDQSKPIYVQTFSSHVGSGRSARKLYLSFGFKDYKVSGKNPAGIDTVIMKLG